MCCWQDTYDPFELPWYKCVIRGHCFNICSFLSEETVKSKVVTKNVSMDCAPTFKYLSPKLMYKSLPLVNLSFLIKQLPRVYHYLHVHIICCGHQNYLVFFITIYEHSWCRTMYDFLELPWYKCLLGEHCFNIYSMGKNLGCHTILTFHSISKNLAI